jgi:hypothetical protein
LKPCDVAGKASVEDGVVLLDGPDGVAVTMTADAAEGTADSLREAAAQVRKDRESAARKARDE